MPPDFPDAALKASRTALRAVPLTTARGRLPAGLSGHLFVISPVGTVDSGGAPYPNGNDRPTVINGDGMMWRFDFAADPSDPTAPPRATLSSELVRPPDLHWDELTRNGSPLDFAGFTDMGMLRASLFLGTRNFANTALVPMPAGDGATRMVCCYDAGPPVEVDPATLDTLGVVGTSWDAEALDGLVAFPPILATAHPFYDPRTGELFAVNYGRSSLSMLETVPLFEALAFLPEAASYALGRLAAALGRSPLTPSIGSAPSRAIGWLTQLARGLSTSRPESVLPQDFLDLVSWQGEGDIVRMPVVDMETGRPATVEQSMHQIAVTRRFVLLLDTNFKLRFDQFYNNPFPNVPELERLLRTALASQQGATSNLWVIRRDAVHAARGASTSRAVPAFKVPLPGAVHFLADYDDSDGIRIQCAHGAALDIAEWVRRDDQRLDGSTAREAMHGMVASPIDVSRLGQYRIDPARRRVVASQVLADDRLWGIALYAARGVPAWDEVPERLTHGFWFASGLWQDNYTLFLRSLYADYRDRLIPLERIDRMVARGGMPSTLVCVDLEAFEICDSFAFPEGVTLSSPQFIPDPGRGGDRGGWITSVVWTREAAWLWVFDAAALAAGPIAELAIPAMLGFSLHTAWLPSVAPAATADAASLRAARDRAFVERRLSRLDERAKRRIREILSEIDR